MTNQELFAKFETWIDVAKWAPSGANAQNWEATVSIVDDRVSVRLSLLNAGEANRSTMDTDGVASIAALGGFEFTLAAVAANDGYAVTSRRLVASPSLAMGHVELEFSPSHEVRRRYANKEIRDRRTDRWPYSRRPLDQEDLDALEAILRRYTNVVSRFFSNSTARSKGELIPYLSNLEKLRWQNANLLNSLLHEISFGKETEVAEDRIASNQLGISKVEQLLLRMLRRWTWLRRLMNLGFHVFAVYRATTVFVRQSDRIYFVSVSGAQVSFEACVELGACLQELWLEAHHRGIAFQPLGLPLIAFSYSKNPGLLGLSDSQSRSIVDLTKNFREVFDVDFRQPTIGFRVGLPFQSERALPPSHRRAVRILRLD
ncbi:hypothetical protein BH10BDE1_BH10BDE1_24350 [soil metagenome]